MTTQRRSISPSVSTLLALLTLCLVTAETAQAEIATIEGVVTLAEDETLPEGAVLDLQLVDISRADAAAERLASIRLTASLEQPQPFTLHYDPALIDPRYTYAVTAEIRLYGRLLFRSDTVHPVLTRGAGDTVEVALVRIADGQPTRTFAMLVGPVWVAEDIDNRGVIDMLQSTVAFTPGGRIQGSGGCNAFTGAYTQSGNKLDIGGDGLQLATTLKACPPAIMDQESRFMDALGRVSAYRIEQGLLHLLDAEGTPILRFWQRGG